MVKALLPAAAILLSVLYSVSAFAMTSLTASVDKNPALQGEAITLEVVADSRLSADAINFRVLEQDFTIMVPSVSSSTQVINGQSSHSTSWKVVLLPKRTGELTIPAFSVQGLSSAPISIKVLNEQVKTATDGSAELFLRSEILQDQLYVQQLSYYQVTIFFNGDLQRGSLSEPQIEGASVTQVGQDVEGSELVNGIRYRTITRRYAIIPQRSGSFTISAPTFNGEMVDRDSARYNYFARTKSVIQQGQPVEINVKAIPDNFPGDWLVAGLVTLTEEWSPDITELKQGEPVTRIITLSAVDVAENQLPELTQGFPEGLRLYQEQPQAKSAQRNGRLVAQKVFTTAVIANKAGTLELPEVVLPWWNSQTNQLDYARLAARQLSVTASSSAAPVNPVVASNLPNNTAPANSEILSNTASSNWQWNHLSSLLLLLWLGSGIVFYLLWPHRTSRQPVTAPASRVKFNHNKLKAACQNNDAAAAKAELLRFAHQQLDQRCHALTELMALLPDTSLQQQLQQLNAALYSPHASQWQGDALWQSWQQYQRQATPGTTDNSLGGLYPHSGAD
ncbi:MAG: BatD family protein [Gammaproteobacteria bacterium]|nr:BatD family protein [Gammaproteobacteria bacterium]